MKNVTQKILSLALPLALSALSFSSTPLESVENGPYPTGNCPSGQCSLNPMNGQYQQYPQYNQNVQCANGQCSLNGQNGQYGQCANGQCSLNGQYGQCANGQCGNGQCYHRGPYYGCNPGWEAGIEKNCNCITCQSNTNRHRFLPDSDTSSYEYYNFYESQCCPQ